MPQYVPQTKGLIDTWGGKTSAPVLWAGPKSYTTGGETVDPKAFGCRELLFLSGVLTESGTYVLRAQPQAKSGYTTWKLLWYAISGGAQVGGSTDLSGETAIVWGFGV